MIRGLGLSLSLIFVPGACAGVPLAPPQADQDAKRFDQPAPGQGRALYLSAGLLGLRCRSMSPSSAVRPPSSTPTPFIRVEGPPGPIDIDCRSAPTTPPTRSRSRMARRAIVEVSMKIHLWPPGCEIAEVPPDQGQAAVLSSKRVDRNNTANVLHERPVGIAVQHDLPTVSKCASRDWICCDSVWMSRKRRSNGVPRKIADVPAAL